MAATMMQGAENLVERSRQGDQLAMAGLKMIRLAARKGIARAQFAFAMCNKYAKDHPVNGAKFGVDEKPEVPKGLLKSFSADEPSCFAESVKNAIGYKHGLLAICVLLANGPKLVPDRIQEIAAVFGTDTEQKCFLHGVSNPRDFTRMPEKLVTCILLGQCVGRARSIQYVRKPKTSVKAVSPMAAWELGE